MLFIKAVKAKTVTILFQRDKWTVKNTSTHSGMGRCSLFYLDEFCCSGRYYSLLKSIALCDMSVDDHLKYIDAINPFRNNKLPKIIDG